MLLRKAEGRNVSVDEHQGLGTVINFPDQTPSEVIGEICCDGNVCTHLPFVPDCQAICGLGIISAPCSECELNFCPPHDSEVTAVVDGVTSCGDCISAGGGVYFSYSFDLDGEYPLGTMSESAPCFWQIVLENAVLQSVYSNPDCTGDPFTTNLYDVNLTFSCSTEYPEPGALIFGRINESSFSAFDVFFDSEIFLHVTPWELSNTLSCSSDNIGTGGTITFSW